MENKKRLILLGMTLLILIVLLVVYAVNSNNSVVQTPSSPLLKTQNQQQLTTEDIEAREQRLAEIEVLKKEMNGVTNETFVMEQPAGEAEDFNSEEVEKYQEEIISGQALIAEGEITEIGDSYLKIQFKQGFFNWVSTVNINETTSIATINENSEQNNIPLTTLEVGGNVVVQSAENITNSNFIAVSIFKII
jgi:hypothetical protein